MLAVSPRFMRSPRFLLPPAMALLVIAALAQGNGGAKPVDAAAAVRARNVACAPAASAVTGTPVTGAPEPACRLARDGSAPAVLR